ncbi:MAG TPA: thiolase family protein [Anaeromyxobacter sp.]|nr:thiolase family protein [Anaeromyxobacter sp.]
MQDVFVIEALRTPFGSLGGALASITAPRLAATVIEALVRRSGVDAARVDEVVVGQVLPAGVGQAPARQAMRLAGLPDEIPATTINKVCGSGLAAMQLAAMSIRTGAAEIAVAGGMESMSLAPYLLARARQGYRLGNGDLLDGLVHDGLRDAYDGRHMGQIADAAAVRHGIGREEQDAFAARSYGLACGAVESGVLEPELVPVEVRGERVARDEEPFRASVERLPGLRPAFGAGGTVTAGNASSLSDGAALALLAGERAVNRFGLRPRARLAAYATSSTAPERFTDAPVEAVRRACAAAKLSPRDVDVWEINEAFSLVPLIAMRELELQLERVNVNGGAVALGHPLAASGGRLVATLVRELHRRSARFGVVTLCIGGGEAVAAVLERV